MLKILKFFVIQVMNRAPYLNFRKPVLIKNLDKMNIENAYIVGLKAITYIMSEEDLLSRFIALSGIGENEISERLQDQYFLSACLDFLLNNEKDLISFCDDSNISPKDPQEAVHILGGNNDWNSP